MAGIKKHQDIPTKWEEREKLHDKGQFWTPSWVVEAMVTYVVRNSDMLYDPAAGRRAFYNALKNVRPKNNVHFYGTDIDSTVFEDEIYQDGMCSLEIRDFIYAPPKNKFEAIVANPPYVRHHRIPEETKQKFKDLSQKIMGFTIDGRAGLHIFFLIQALNLLQRNGKLAFIMPADTCEGVFATKLWKWIATNYCIEVVVTFLSEATPFPNVDTNAMVFLIKNTKPKDKLFWIKAKEAYSDNLKDFIASGFSSNRQTTLDIVERQLQEAVETGLSRKPTKNNFKYRLSDFASVMRGIATGANEFFFLTSEQVNEIKINDEFLERAVGRTRDIEGDIITPEVLRKLDEKGRPTYLFSPDGREINEFPKKVSDYLKYGETLELHERALIKTRNPWYKMEQRKVPKFLFAYLGRRNARFIRNETDILPLTSFLCVYPHYDDKEFISKLWIILNHPATLENLILVAKSYGSGAIKVEPRSLEKLPIPDSLIEKYQLISEFRNKNGQFRMFREPNVDYKKVRRIYHTQKSNY